MKIIHWLTSLILCVLVVAVSADANGQCTYPAPPTSATCGSSGQLAYSNSGTTSGKTYYYNSGGPYSGNINGGTLVICGAMTLSSSNFWSGNIIIEPGGSLAISGVSQLGVDIVNYGTLSITPSGGTMSVDNPIWNSGEMTVTGSIDFNGGAFYNTAATSSVVVSADMLSSVPIVNNGGMTVKGTLTIDGGGVCMGGGSTLGVTNLHDEGYLFTVTPSGGNTTATLGVTGTLTTSNPITGPSSNLVLCEGPGETNSGNPGTGVTVHTNCTLTTLPITLVSFSASAENNICTLEWTTAKQVGLVNFDIQYSTDAVNYETLANVPAEQEMDSYTYTTTIKQNTWFRLRMVNQDSSYVYSTIVPVDYQGGAASDAYVLRIQPNLITNNTLQVWSNMSSAQSGEWWVVDMMGRTVMHQPAQLSAGTTTSTIPLPALSSGIYHLLFAGSQVKLSPVAFSVMR